MNRENLERVLNLVRREMGCNNARLELGGDPPDAAEVLCAQMPNGFRLVAVFREPPSDRAKANLRLRQLATSFFDTEIQTPEARDDAERNLLQRRLDDELYALTGRSGGVGAVVIDLQSPVVWGCSEGRAEIDAFEDVQAVAELDDLARARGLDLSMVSGLVESEQRTAIEPFEGETRLRLERLLEKLGGRSLRSRRAYLLRARVLLDIRAWTRSFESSPPSSLLRRAVHQTGVGYLARSFAGIYMLIVYFPGGYSELHVEAAALHALPMIEGMVLSLPPVDPPPPKGKVVQLPRR